MIAKHLTIVSRRVIKQLILDKRYLFLSIVAPLIIIGFYKLFADAITSSTPGFVIARYAVPISAFIVHFLCFILCAIALVQERKDGTLERLFINGVNRSSIIGGYALGYFGLATLQSFIVLAETIWLFDLNFTSGEIMLIFIVIWLLAIVSVLLGIFVSTFARSEGHVFPFIPLLILPSIFLSGLLIDVSLLPNPVQVFSHLLPLNYANNILQDIVFDDLNIHDTLLNVGILVGYAMFLWVLASSTLKETE